MGSALSFVSVTVTSGGLPPPSGPQGSHHSGQHPPLEAGMPAGLPERQSDPWTCRTYPEPQAQLLEEPWAKAGALGSPLVSPSCLPVSGLAASLPWQASAALAALL